MVMNALLVNDDSAPLNTWYSAVERAWQRYLSQIGEADFVELVADVCDVIQEGQNVRVGKDPNNGSDLEWVDRNGDRCLGWCWIDRYEDSDINAIVGVLRGHEEIAQAIIFSAMEEFPAEIERLAEETRAIQLVDGCALYGLVQRTLTDPAAQGAVRSWEHGRTIE